MMSIIRFNLFQDRDTREVTILPRMTGADRLVRFGDAVALSEEAFRERGLASVQRVLALLRTDPHSSSSWTTDNIPMWAMYRKKPRTIELELSLDRPEATVNVLHYDNSEVASPCLFNEETTSVSLEVPPDAFADYMFGRLARSKDYISMRMSLWDVVSFFCVYRDDRTGLFHWFDWVGVPLPDGHTDAVTAWGSHRIFDKEGLRVHCRHLTIQSLRDFVGRKEAENPNPNPRGSQVEDAGVVYQRRVVVYQKEDPNEAIIRVYNFDSVEQEQVESGIEISLPLDCPEEVFQETFLNAFERCEIE